VWHYITTSNMIRCPISKLQSLAFWLASCKIPKRNANVSPILSPHIGNVHDAAVSTRSESL